MSLFLLKILVFSNERAFTAYLGSLMAVRLNQLTLTMSCPQAVGDGKGTAKEFLEDIASQESEAERSLMHRCVIIAFRIAGLRDEKP